MQSDNQVSFVSQLGPLSQGVSGHPEFNSDNRPPVCYEVANLPSYRILKRSLDLFIVLMSIPFLLPAIVVISLVVRLDSRGPIFFRHVRLGRGGSTFVMLKFRTMHANSDDVLNRYLKSHADVREEWRKTHKLRYDPRITRAGRLLRQFSLDELPQLWNVFMGDMSLVGPRPIVSAEVAKYGKRFSCYGQVKPGITGLWQVSGRSHISYPKRVALDCKYVNTWSNSLDIAILFRTISAVASRRGAF